MAEPVVTLTVPARVPFPAAGPTGRHVLRVRCATCRALVVRRVVGTPAAWTRAGGAWRAHRCPA